MQQDIARGSVPAAAYAVTKASVILAHLPDVVSTLVGIAALVYYYLVISKLLAERRAVAQQLQQSSARVAVPILEERHGSETD